MKAIMLSGKFNWLFNELCRRLRHFIIRYQVSGINWTINKQIRNYLALKYSNHIPTFSLLCLHSCVSVLYFFHLFCVSSIKCQFHAEKKDQIENKAYTLRNHLFLFVKVIVQLSMLKIWLIFLLRQTSTSASFGYNQIRVGGFFFL